MKILLAACNAKYIHSNLAVYNLKAYANAYDAHIILKEYTIEILSLFFAILPQLIFKG